MKVAIVIPSRWGSRRLPGKPLITILKKPLIQHVYERATCSKEAFVVVVATDDARIEEKVQRFGGEVVRTRSDARTGSDRVAELMDRIPADAYVNLQGDELIQNAAILDELIIAFKNAQPLEMGTLKVPIRDSAEITNPNVVKVVTDRNDMALYFSRSPIPSIRKDNAKQGMRGIKGALETGPYYKHIGIYIYERETLKKFSNNPSGLLEDIEQLEQLRALEMGLGIRVWETNHESFRIDTRSDLKEAERNLKRGHRAE